LGKPHPGAYLSTAAKLGVDPTACLAVEDSFNGAVSAKAARMRVVAVPEPDALGSPRWGMCDAVLPSLLGLDETLLRSLQQ
jgi:sugar-phosphatase